jgi:NADPH2:quinone reductase
MRVGAVVAAAPGGPEALRIEEVELPWPRRAHDVLVELRAAGLNPADVFFRQLGGYVAGPNPLVLGHDGMGVVREVGPAVTAVAPGDRVCFCNGGIGGELGTYAEAAVVPDWQLARVPDAVDDLTAAALPLVAITAWEALHDRARLQGSEFVLVHAGAGGTGHLAVQLAALAGARVATTVGSAEKARLATSLGAERPILYRDEDFVAVALDWSGRGVQVALDNVGPEVMRRSFRAMAPYGRVVTLMGTPGDDDDLTAYNLNLSLLNVMMLTPMWRGIEPRLREQADIVRRTLALVVEGRLRILHAETFPLSRVAEAHALLESGRTVGKVTLRIAEG